MQTSDDRAMMKRVLGGAAIVVAAGVGIIAYSGPTLESNPPQIGTAAATRHAAPGVAVLAAPATAENVPIILRGLGAVQAYNTVTVKSRVDGNIVKVGFVEGQYVKKGDLLFEIDPRPYQAQLEQAQANKAKDEANLANAKLILARYAALLPTHLATTQQQYDTQKAQVEQLTASVQNDQAQIDAAKLNVAYCAITSPIDGISGVRLVDTGNLIEASAATPLVVVTQIKPIFVTFTVPEQDLGQVRRMMAQHALKVLAFNGDDNRQLSEGVLKVINNEVARNSGTVMLKAEFANADAALWPGQFVNAHLVLRVVEHGITVPAAAVLMGPSGLFVYRITAASTVEPIAVKIIEVENGRALVTGKGLASGQQVVASGQAELTPGAKVAVKPGEIGQMNAREPEIGAEGVGSTGVTTAPQGVQAVTPR
jgi:membrane fusion protein, multidrug efflux system